MKKKLQRAILVSITLQHQMHALPEFCVMNAIVPATLGIASALSLCAGCIAHRCTNKSCSLIIEEDLGDEPLLNGASTKRVQLIKAVVRVGIIGLVIASTDLITDYVFCAS